MKPFRDSTDPPPEPTLERFRDPAAPADDEAAPTYGREQASDELGMNAGLTERVAALHREIDELTLKVKRLAALRDACFESLGFIELG